MHYSLFSVFILKINFSLLNSFVVQFDHYKIYRQFSVIIQTNLYNDLTCKSQVRIVPLITELLQPNKIKKTFPKNHQHPLENKSLFLVFIVNSILFWTMTAGLFFLQCMYFCGGVYTYGWKSSGGWDTCVYIWCPDTTGLFDKLLATS